MVRNKQTGYPVSVNKEQLDTALKSGNYEVIPDEQTGGVYYSGWIGNRESGNMFDGYIPEGYRIVQDSQTKKKI